MKDIVPSPPPVVRNDVAAVKALFQQNVVPSYGRFEIVLSHGAGSYLYDITGRRYLDLGAGIAVSSLGHAHPAITEALVEQYETCLNTIGLDPVAIQTLHDVADAATTTAATMAAAVKKFAEHYELPTQFVSDGGLLAHDGRWHKGDGD